MTTRYRTIKLMSRVGFEFNLHKLETKHKRNQDGELVKFYNKLIEPRQTGFRFTQIMPQKGRVKVYEFSFTEDPSWKNNLPDDEKNNPKVDYVTVEDFLEMFYELYKAEVHLGWFTVIVHPDSVTAIEKAISLGWPVARIEGFNRMEKAKEFNAIEKATEFEKEIEAEIEAAKDDFPIEGKGSKRAALKEIKAKKEEISETIKQG